MKKEADTCCDGFDVDDSGGNNKEERDYFSLKERKSVKHESDLGNQHNYSIRFLITPLLSIVGMDWCIQ